MTIARSLKDPRVRALLVVLAVAVVLAYVAIGSLGVSPETKSRLRRVVVTGAGIAAAVLLGAVALAGAPWYVAAGAAAAALVATGAYNVIASTAGLPQVGGGGGGGDDGLPDPCVVGPYIGPDGIARVCSERG